MRAPRWADLDDMVKFVNSLVEEGSEIGTTQKITRDFEVDWLARHIVDLEKDMKVAIVAEVNGMFAGQVEVRPLKGSSQHVGDLIIALFNSYRDIGIGTEMMKEAEIQARRIGLEIITLKVYASNNRARHVYKKLGYQVVGCIPKGFLRNGSYTDKIIMMKNIL
ncbi:MAG: GNAT family N-acetyltransferase [Candidatus Hodarchaeota archaeon]